MKSTQTKQQRVLLALLGCVAGLVSLSGCQGARSSQTPTQAPMQMPSTAEADPEGRQEGDSPEELKRRLDRLVQASTQHQNMRVSTAEPTFCEDQCSLASSICEVQSKLCELSDQHPGDVDYQALCREGKQECREARDRCTRCIEEQNKNGAPKGSTSSSPEVTSPAGSR